MAVTNTHNLFTGRNPLTYAYGNRRKKKKAAKKVGIRSDLSVQPKNFFLDMRTNCGLLKRKAEKAENVNFLPLFCYSF